MSEVLSKINEFSDAFFEHRKNTDRTMAEVVERIELLETKKEAPKLARNDGAEFKVFHTDHGDVYELPSHV